MADYPALPLWTDAYIADTMHMSCLESGAYLHLLMAAWRSPTCTLPNDDKQLARMARCTPKEWQRVRTVVMSFWMLDEETQKWSQKRLLREREYVRVTSEKAKHAAEARWLKNKDTGDADASPEHMPDTCKADAPIPIPIPIKNIDRVPIPTHIKNIDRGGWGARDTHRVVERFEALRAELWPDESALPAPRLTLAAQAQVYLDDGVPSDVLTELIERLMRQRQSRGYRATTDLRAFSRSLPDAVNSWRRAGQAQPKPPRTGTAAVLAELQNIAEASRGY